MLVATRDNAEFIMQVHAAHAVPTWLPPDQFEPDVVRQWFFLCAELGFHSVFWTVNYAGKGTYHSDVLPRMTPLDERYYGSRGIAGGSAWENFNRIGAALRRFDTLDVAIATAAECGISLYCDLALFDLYFPGLESDFFESHPEYWLRGRKGGRPSQMYGQILMPEPYQRLAFSETNPREPGQTCFRGIPCYAEPCAREYWLSVVRELIGRGVENFAFNLISHVQFGCGNTWSVINGEGPDSFGFNPSVVAEYRDRFGGHNLSEQFEPGRLRELHGEFFTNFLREIRQTIGPNCRLLTGMTMEGRCGFGADLSQFQFELDWPRWIEDRIADGLIVYNSPPDSIGQTQREIKGKLNANTDVYLWRAIGGPDDFPSLRREIEQVRAGALDGFVLKELAPFCRPETKSWRALFKTGEHRGSGIVKSSTPQARDSTHA